MRSNSPSRPRSDAFNRDASAITPKRRDQWRLNGQQKNALDQKQPTRFAVVRVCGTRSGHPIGCNESTTHFAPGDFEYDWNASGKPSTQPQLIGPRSAPVPAAQSSIGADMLTTPSDGA